MLTSQCTATVSGGAGSTLDGETLTFTQTGGSGSVSFPGAATCTLSGNGCSITVTGTSLGQAIIRASYLGDASNAASSGNTSVTVLAATATSVTCTPSLVDIGGTSTCTATVTGAGGTITGETITFSQPSGETGSVTVCSTWDVRPWFRGKLLDIGDRRNPGAVTIEATYPGDANNGASSGTASLTALFIHSTVTASTSSSSSTSSSTGTSSTFTSSTTTSTSYSQSSTTTSSSSTSSSGGLGSTAYLILAAVAVIVIVFGVVMWRRKVAGDSNQPAAR